MQAAGVFAGRFAFQDKSTPNRYFRSPFLVVSISHAALQTREQLRFGKN
jgi:hypothetical protein